MYSREQAKRYVKANYQMPKPKEVDEARRKAEILEAVNSCRGNNIVAFVNLKELSAAEVKEFKISTEEFAKWKQEFEELSKEIK